MDGVVNADTDLGSGEGVDISWSSVATSTYKKGDTYNGSTVTTVSDLIAYINGTDEPAGFTLTASRDAATVARYKISYTVSGTSAQATQTAASKKVYATFGTNPLTGAAINLVGTISDVTLTASTIAAALADQIEQLTAYTASSTAWDSTAGAEIVVAALVSNTSNRDLSSIEHSLPTLAITTNSVTAATQVNWASDADNVNAQYSTISNIVQSNTLAIASSLFSLSISKSEASNLRLTLSSSNNAVNIFSGASAASITIEGTPSTLATETFAQDWEDGYDLITGLGIFAVDLTAGTNIVATSISSSTLDYEAGFSDIEAVVTTAGNDTDRTGWLN